MKRPKETAARRRVGGLESGSPGGRTEQQSKGGRPPLQDNRLNLRNRSQPAPAWPEPKGTVALRQLERLWGPPRVPLIRNRRGRS
jgi:hypothetical protein